MHVRATALAAMALACALTSALAAQAGGPTASAKPAIDSLPPATPWTPKPTGSYEIVLGVPDSPTAATIMPEGPMAATLAIKDSSGALTAIFWKHGDHDGHAMSVTTNGTDLVLDAETPHGALRITLQQHGQALTGSWSLAGQGAGVTGRRTS